MIFLRLFTILLRLSNRNTASLKTLGRYSISSSFFSFAGGTQGGTHDFSESKYKPIAKPVTHLNYWGKGNWDMAPEQGLEPRTYWLTANRSTIELLRNPEGRKT